MKCYSLNIKAVLRPPVELGQHPSEMEESDGNFAVSLVPFVVNEIDLIAVAATNALVAATLSSSSATAVAWVDPVFTLD